MEAVNEEDNYRLLGDLVVNFATREIQKIFFARYETLTKEPWGRKHLSGKQFFEIRTPKELRQMYGKLGDEDRQKLDGDACDWDITMLDKVLSNIDFSSQNPTLKNQHNEENRHMKAIKTVRNKYSHPTQKRIPQSEFEDLWEKAKQALVALGSSESEIDKIEASRYVTSFKLFEPPTKKFTGRKDLLQKMHEQMRQCSTKAGCLDRIVVLSGLGGIGKSELARKYAKTYIEDPIIQNVAWIDAEEERGMKASFVSIANRFKIPSEGKGLKEIVKLVYAHFSNHIKNGLFIFDNSKQMIDRPFGLEEYLPTQESLKQRPLILLTARDQEWNIPNENVITVSELSQRESIELLQKKFRLEKENENYKDYEKLVAKLADALQGYPLGLALATSNIKSIKDWTRLKAEMERYLDRIGEPQGDWMGQDQHRAATKYKLIMENVWEVTLDKIKDLGDAGQRAINLLSIIAYFPPDQIKKDQIERIFEAFHSTALTSNVFDLLEKYSLVKVETLADYYTKNEEVHLIRIHRLVQLTTRDKLDRERNFSYLLGLCNYFSHPEQDEEFHEKDKMRVLHELLKERNYPEKSIRFSLSFCSLCMCSFDYSHIEDLARDVYAFMQTDGSKEGIEADAGEDAFKLLVLCMFWVNSSEDSRRKCGNIVLKGEELESVFASVIEPATAFALTSTEGPKSLQEHCYVLCVRLLPDILTVNEKSAGQLIPRIVSTLKATPCSSLKYISTLYKNLWKLLRLNVSESLALLEPIFEKHFQIYDRLGSKKELREYWGFWEDGPLNLLFINEQLWDKECRECINGKMGRFEGSNDFVETFIRARGLEILCQHVVFLTQYKILLNNSYALLVIRSLAYYLNRRKELVTCAEFLTAFAKFTKLMSKENYSPWDKFTCLMGWFCLYSRQKPDVGYTGASIHTIASVLDEMLSELKEVDDPDSYISGHFDDELVIQEFVETFQDEANCGAVRTAIRVFTDETSPSPSAICTPEIEMMRLEETIQLIQQNNESSWRLLRILAYLKSGTPLAKIEATFRHIFSQDVREDAFTTLAHHSLLSMYKTGDDLPGRDTDCVLVPHALKLFLRTKLLDNNDAVCLIEISKFEILETLKKGEESNGHFSSLHEYLKDFKWSQNSVYISMIFGLFLTKVATINGVGFPGNSNKSLSLVEDVYDFCASRSVPASAEINWYETDSFPLFQLCLFWVSLKEIDTSHRMWKDSNLSKNALSNTFLTSIEPSVEYFLHPQTDLPLIQHLTLRISMHILKSIPFVMQTVEAELQKKMKSNVLKSVNALNGCATENVLDLFKMLWDFHNYATSIDSLDYMETILKKHFQIYTKSFKSSPSSTLKHYWDSCGPLYLYRVEETCKRCSHAEKINISNCFLANDGPKIMVHYFAYKDECKAPYNFYDGDILRFLLMIAYELNFAETLIESTEFLEKFSTYTRNALAQQDTHFIIFECATLCFALMARQGGRKDEKEWRFFFEVVARQLEDFIKFIKLHDVVRLVSDRILVLTEDVLKTFLETFADKCDSLAFQTASTFLDLVRFLQT